MLDSVAVTRPAIGRFWRTPWPWLVGALLLASFALLRGRDDAPADPRPMGTADDILALAERDDVNVLFVLIDTLRAHRLSAYGYPRPTTPFLGFLASQGVRFDRHTGQSSWTKCSMASLWTGLYPQRSGVTRFEDVIPEEARTAAEIFRDAGFRTAGIWRNGWVEGYFGFDQGFEVYTRPNARRPSVEVLRENPTFTHRGSDFDAVDTAAEFLRVYGRERWFLYLHLMDVHEYTYTPESAKFGSTYGDIYDNAILHTDQVLGELFGLLYEGGHLDETLWIVGSDHGEAFGERGSEGHARNVYPETTEVPLILGLPFRLERPAVVRGRTANVDLWPTVLDLLGLPPLDDPDGRSKVPEMLAAARGEAAPEDAPAAIAHLDQTWGQRVPTRSPNVSVVDGEFSYLLFGAPDGAAREELYRLGAREWEREDLAREQPEVAARMRAQAKEYLAQEPSWTEPNSGLELDEIQLEQLRALGYAVPGR